MGTILSLSSTPRPRAGGFPGLSVCLSPGQALEIEGMTKSGSAQSCPQGAQELWGETRFPQEPHMPWEGQLSPAGFESV